MEIPQSDRVTEWNNSSGNCNFSLHFFHIFNLGFVDLNVEFGVFNCLIVECRAFVAVRVRRWIGIVS